jgi:SET domain-containing protein
MRVIEQQGKTILYLDHDIELEVRKSSIHGMGVFAVTPIPPETKLLEYKGEKITKAESQRRGVAQMENAGDGGRVYIFELNKRYDIDGNVPDNYTRFVNHSCEPNCEARVNRGKIYYYSLRNIEPGEELFIDYGYDMEHFLDHPCHCGTPSCIGYIVQKDQRWRVKRLLQKKKGSRSLIKKVQSETAD